MIPRYFISVHAGDGVSRGVIAGPYMSRSIAAGIAKRLSEPGKLGGELDNEIKMLVELETLKLEFMAPGSRVTVTSGDRKSYVDITAFDYDDDNDLPMWWALDGGKLANEFSDLYPLEEVERIETEAGLITFHDEPVIKKGTENEETV